jgi:pSer/pThr/pTyr-binding forkhead associated (FHA) protein
LHDDPSPRPAAIADLPQARPPEENQLTVGAIPALRRYLIGLDLVGHVHEITPPRVSVGRTQDNDLRIVDPTVSRLHAVLNAQGADVTVIDANSRNGVYVNGIQVRHAKLSDGDLLTFGTVRFRYRIGSAGSGGGFGPA